MKTLNLTKEQWQNMNMPVIGCNVFLKDRETNKKVFYKVVEDRFLKKKIQLKLEKK